MTKHVVVETHCCAEVDPRFPVEGGANSPEGDTRHTNLPEFP